MTDASQTHTLESALAEIDEIKAQLAVQGKAWLTAELDLKAQLNAEREMMNRTARTIIATLRGNGGWLGLGNSDVESAVASYMQSSNERIAKEANRAAEMEAQANQERERAEAAEDRYGKRAYDAVMALHRKSQQDAIDATARADKAEALTKRAVDILVAEELDRDFGEKPSATTLAVRAIMAEMGLKPETCSMGAVIGYISTTTVKE